MKNSKPLKRLPKDLLEEGISVDLINSIDLSRRCSPVMLQKGDEPVRLLICSTGFNVIVGEGEILRDEKNKPIVFTEKECRVGRARYLVNHGQLEKEQRVNDLITSWKTTVRDFLDKVKKKVESIQSSLSDEKPGGMPNFIKAMAQERWPAVKAQLEEELKSLEPSYLAAEKMFSENKIVEIMNTLGLKSFSNPMLSVKYEDQKEMKVMINTFGAKALQNWNGDILIKYAEIEIEREFPN